MSGDSHDRDAKDRLSSRRELLGVFGPAALAMAGLGGVGTLLHGRAGRHRPPSSDVAPPPRDWRVGIDQPGRLAVAGASGPRVNVRRAVAALGGMGAFVRAGERVLIKPNCAWDRTPEQAANTDPEVVAELVRLCLEAGAASVVVADNTCHDPDRTFARSGIAAAARAAGAGVAHQRTAGTVRLALGGTRLGPWQVLRPVAEADRVINVPVVKQHSLTRATLGMKNWFGVVVGNRSSLHQRAHQVCAELGAAFRPTLTVVDATRILARGGPTGGSLDLVSSPDLVAVATDPVAADAWGGSLLDLDRHQLQHLAIAERLGLGTADWRSLLVQV